MRLTRPLAVVAATALAAGAAQACDDGSVPIFACEASNGRKFIELCSSSPPSADGFLEYRFGALGPEGRAATAELVFPAERKGSMRRFFAATYTHRGVYTQSVRFTTATHSYTAFTGARGRRDEGAGVEVKARDSARVTTIHCSERPRFYIFELRGLVACDPQTPVGTACVR